MPLRPGRSGRRAVIGHPVVRVLPRPGSADLVDRCARGLAAAEMALRHNRSETTRSPEGRN